MLAHLVLLAQIVPMGGITTPVSGGGGAKTVTQVCSLVQFPTTVTSITCTNPGNTNFTAGHGIAIVFQNNGNFTITGVTGCTGDVPVQDIHSPQAGATSTIALWFITSTLGGCHAITVTTLAATTGNLAVVEIAPSGTRDVSAGATGLTNMAPNPGSLTTTSANEVLISAYDSGNSSGTITLPTSFTSVVSNGLGSTAYRIVSSIGTYSTAWATTLSTSWAAVAAGYE